MKAPPFAYARATSVGDALGLLQEAGEDAKVLAGGQSLAPLLAYRLVRPSHLVDIDGVADLAGTESAQDGTFRLGALTRHAWIERNVWSGRRKLLGEAASHIGHVPIRTRGTIGGSVAHADPAAELPVALVALDAVIETQTSEGTRRTPADEFFTGPFATVLEHAEIVTAVDLPPCDEGTVGAFEEFAVRSGDFALAAVAVAAHVVDGTIRDARVVLGGVGPTAVRSAAAEAVLEGEEVSTELVASAASAAAAGCDPPTDPATSAAYRRVLVEHLIVRALGRALGAGR